MQPFGHNTPTQLNEYLWTQVLKHLNVHICLATIAYRYYNQLISRTDLSPIPVRSAAKSYITSWCIHEKNLSKRVLNRQTVSTSTTKLGRLYVQKKLQRYRHHCRQRSHSIGPDTNLTWLTPSNLNRFSKFFHQRIHELILSKMIVKDPTILRMLAFGLEIGECWVNQLISYTFSRTSLSKAEM